MLYSFAGGSDGAQPQAAVVDVNGTFYGTTKAGGTNGSLCPTGCGTAFSFSGSTEHILHRFSGADGLAPQAPLTKIGTLLYGTTWWGGGTSNAGTVFSISLSGTVNVLHAFNGTDGLHSLAAVINAKPLARRTVYGTASGQYINPGTAFALIVSGGQQGRFAVLHTFTGAPDGYGPSSPLVQLNGQLYGTTINGGYSNSKYGSTPHCRFYYGGTCGTLFSLTNSGQEHVKWEFGIPNYNGSQDGAGPSGQLAVLGGVLYGTTGQGGDVSHYWPFGAGTVFSYNPYGFSQPETVLHRFDPNSGDGAFPNGGLIVRNGNFYGTTHSGGTYGYGTVFEITPSGTETILHSFGFPSSGDGEGPNGSLLFVRGVFYGTTDSGGTQGLGTIFAVRP